MRPDWGYYGTYDESAHPDLWNGVVGYWAPCLGPTGLRLHDVSRRNDWGTLTNMDAATDWVVDAGQYALDFDGSNDYLLLPEGNRLYSNLLQVTWSFWVKFNSFPNAYNILVETFDNNNNIYQFTPLVKSNGKLAFYVYGANVGNQSSYDGTGEFTLVSDRWYNLTFVFHGSVRQQGFVDGTLDGSAASVVAAMSQNVVTCFINFNRSVFGTRQWPGDLSDAIVYNRALSPNEVRRLYELGRGGMLERKRRRRVYTEQAGFRAHYRPQRAQLIGGGLR